MKIIHWESDIKQVTFCCNPMWLWVSGSLIHIQANADTEKCFALLMVSEEGETVHFCPGCGKPIEFQHE